MSAKGPYARVYQSIVDDPMFERVYDTPTLATWLRMLLVADAMYPVSAPIGRRNPAINLLIEVGLVIVKPGNRYSMRGLEAERERRSDAARNAAVMRWHSDGNAEAMPRRDETNRTEQTNGQSPPQTFMGWKPKRASVPDPIDLADIERQQAESLADMQRKTAARLSGKGESA